MSACNVAHDRYSNSISTPPRSKSVGQTQSAGLDPKTISCARVPTRRSDRLILHSKQLKSRLNAMSGQLALQRFRSSVGHRCNKRLRTGQSSFRLPQCGSNLVERGSREIGSCAVKGHSFRPAATSFYTLAPMASCSCCNSARGRMNFSIITEEPSLSCQRLLDPWYP